ncbi:MAG: glycosyl hydrolase, partial [Gemmatimonadetes bacterium]|nr:glycosyl hydrolase [Gemmatimonadota bacterium]
GEQNNRQSTSYGNGVYRSDDGGETWRHLGLEETRHTGKIQIHPTDPDIAYVGALGNLWAASDDRGVYKTTDGGRSWEKILFVDEYTGIVDMVIDPSNPTTVYAATYQRLRRAWGFNGGGPGSGIYKTTDGGRNWNRLEGGIPDGDLGRIGLAISESNPQVLMALIEHADQDQQGTYRTENGGLIWERVSSQNIRPMYYSHIFIDPTNEDRVYTLATRSAVSNDGGRTFTPIAIAPTYDVGIHADHHALWIDPNDPEHLYLAGDAGLNESYDGGINFRRLNNFPIAQFYAIGVDMRDPYWVYGGLQDNHSFMGPSETRRWTGIVNDDWMQNGFGDGMYWQADPRDSRYSYGSSNGGSYFRYDTRTGDMQDISPRAPLGERYRFDWTSPMMLSQHDPNVLYVAGNRFFTSNNRGSSWERTEDLSRQIDRDRLELMGVRGSDIAISRNDGTGSFGEAVTLDESPIDPAILWVGFDDGNLQVSRDRGAS